MSLTSLERDVDPLLYREDLISFVVGLTDLGRDNEAMPAPMMVSPPRFKVGRRVGAVPGEYLQVKETI